MERSGPDDARDDAPDDGWDDDAPIYPPAPIPAHERTWRHPSEMGQAAWATTEPPVTIGRGLLVTSGAIGSALGVAVLYLLLPAGGAAPSASPSATSSIASLRTPVVTVADEPDTTGSTLATIVASTVQRVDDPVLTLPAADTPSTVLVMAVETPSDQPVSIAVSIEGDPYVVTTASALESIGDVTLLGPGDTELTAPMTAELVSIDGDLAYLEPSAQMEVVSFASTAIAEPGQIVTVLADDPTDVAYVDTTVSGGVPGLDAGRIVEGTPVIDDAGALVALCTVVIDAEGAYVEMIPVDGSSDPSASTTDPSADGSDPTDGSGDGSGNDGDDADGTASSEPSTDPTGSGGPSDSTSDGRNDGSTTQTTPSTPATPATPAAPPSPATATATTVVGDGSPGATGGASATTAPGSQGNQSNQGNQGTAPTTSGPASTAWAGLKFDGAPTSDPLTVMGVVAGGPAMTAGVMVGERVVAVDGLEVTTVEEVAAAIKRRRPGDVLRLTLAPRSTATPAVSSNATPAAPRTISVVLGSLSPTV